MTRIVAVGLSFVLVLGLATSAQATSLAFTFGDGTQGPLSGSVGPGVAQPAATWNLVNASGWPNNGNQFNTFSGDFTTAVGALVSDSSTLGTPISLTVHDTGQYYAWMWYGEWGGCVGTAANSAPAGTYDEQHVVWSPAQHMPYTTDFTFSNIPYASYDVYIGGRNLWHGTTQVVVGGTKLEGLTGSSFTVSNPLRGAYDSNAYAWLSYVQIVEAGGQPNPPALTTSIPDATPISLTSPTSTTLTLGNSGGGTITGTAGVTGGDASLFTVTPGTVNLGASATQNYTVSFIGTAVGTFGTTLSILTDAGNLSYALSATVTAPAWPDYLAGDFNKDGQVGPEDFGILKDTFGTSNLAHGNHESWTLGDANDDGQIGPEDFGLLKDSFGTSNGPTGTYPLANVPEPTALALLALAGLAIRRKHR